jgi:hypothetical protein
MDMTPLADRAVAHACAYLAAVGERTVRATFSADDLRARLGGPLPERRDDPIRVIDAIAEAGRSGTVASQGPRYFGFVTGGSVPAAIAADWLVSAWDQNAQMFVMSPFAAVVEQIVSEWLKELFGVPPAWSVGFVTGAQMATFASLLAARHHLLRQADWDVERHGLFGAPPIEVVVSAESHRTIFRRRARPGAERVRRVDTMRRADASRSSRAHRARRTRTMHRVRADRQRQHRRRRSARGNRAARPRPRRLAARRRRIRPVGRGDAVAALARRRHRTRRFHRHRCS